MTNEQVNLLKLGISPVNDRTCLIVESALQWVLDNTTLEFDMNKNEDLQALQANVRLFVVKYFEIMSRTGGVTSQSIEGLSQSFDTGNSDAWIENKAEELLGKWLVSRVRFVPAVSKW